MKKGILYKLELYGISFVICLTYLLFLTLFVFTSPLSFTVLPDWPKIPSSWMHIYEANDMPKRTKNWLFKAVFILTFLTAAYIYLLWSKCVLHVSFFSLSKYIGYTKTWIDLFSIHQNYHNSFGKEERKNSRRNWQSNSPFFRRRDWHLLCCLTQSW